MVLRPRVDKWLIRLGMVIRDQVVQGGRAMRRKDIASADFDFGLEIWSEFVNNAPKAASHILSTALAKDAVVIWNSQSLESRKGLLRKRGQA